jgi:hypothetical protein
VKYRLWYCVEAEVAIQIDIPAALTATVPICTLKLYLEEAAIKIPAKGTGNIK